MTSKKVVNAKGITLPFGFGGGAKKSFSWADSDPSRVVRLIDVCNMCNCAVSFSLTRDGGAGRVFFLHDQIPQDERSQYCNPGMDVDEFLSQLIDFWEGMLDTEKRSQNS
jgi:hypothetical protein